MSAILLKHLDALGATVTLLQAQIEAARHAVTTDAPKAALAVDQRPTRCAGVSERECALMDDDAKISRASFAARGAWRCVGCGYEET